MKDNQHEQLFSELTPAEAAVVEGGLRLTIERIKCIENGADILGPDDTFMTLDGKRFWGAYSMVEGQTRNVNKSYTNSVKAVNVKLFDGDPIGGDDELGGFLAFNTNGALRSKRVSGGGSEYEVFYRASA